MEVVLRGVAGQLFLCRAAHRGCGGNGVIFTECRIILSLSRTCAVSFDM